jgi:hypothetical protein
MPIQDFDLARYLLVIVSLKSDSGLFKSRIGQIKAAE